MGPGRYHIAYEIGTTPWVGCKHISANLIGVYCSRSELRVGIRRRCVYGGLSFVPPVSVLFILIVFRFFTADVIGRQSDRQSITAQPDSLGPESEVVRFLARDSLSIEGWFLPAAKPTKGNTVLAHGGGSNRSRMLGRAAFLIEAGFNVLATDLGAHGGRKGDLNSFGMLEALDVLGAVDFLTSAGGAEPMVLMGLSHGSASSMNAAAQSPEISAVVTEGATSHMWIC